jgi:hypothetical protein
MQKDSPFSTTTPFPCHQTALYNNDHHYMKKRMYYHYPYRILISTVIKPDRLPNLTTSNVAITVLSTHQPRNQQMQPL